MYRRVAQLDSVLGTLAAWFPQLCTRHELPNRSIQGRPIYALQMHAGDARNRRGVLLIGGMHARELMNPDAILELALDLVRCYLLEAGLKIGNRQWSALDIKVMLEALDIWMLPCANPDGRERVMYGDDLWRKNMKDNPNTACDGVDVNRNLDIVWGVTTSNTSCNPCIETYVGAGPFSEPESRNIKYLCDTRRIDVFLDVHSYLELVLYPWAHAPTQTTAPTQRFTNLAAGTCAPLNPSSHREYMSPRDRLRFQRVARRVADDIKAVRGRSYRQGSVYETVYATTGTSSDYVYSRHIGDGQLRKTYGFAFETGPFVGNSKDSFQPTDPAPIKRDAKAGMISLMLQSICAIEFIGATLPLKSVPSIRGVRDQRLATTEAGREWIALFERVQVPLLGAILADRSLSREAISLLERAEKLLANDEATVGERDAKRSLALLDVLAERVPSVTVRHDLVTARKELAKMGGKSVRAILKDLLGTRRRPARKVTKRARRS